MSVQAPQSQTPGLQETGGLAHSTWEERFDYKGAYGTMIKRIQILVGSGVRQ